MPGGAGHSSIRAFRGYFCEAAPAPERREERQLATHPKTALPGPLALLSDPDLKLWAQPLWPACLFDAWFRGKTKHPLPARF